MQIGKSLEIDDEVDVFEQVEIHLQGRRGESHDSFSVEEIKQLLDHLTKVIDDFETKTK